MDLKKICTSLFCPPPGWNNPARLSGMVGRAAARRGAWLVWYASNNGGICNGNVKMGTIVAEFGHIPVTNNKRLKGLYDINTTGTLRPLHHNGDSFFAHY